MSENKLHVRDRIIHNGKIMEVAHIICQGRDGQERKNGTYSKGEKAVVSAYPIMSNGQILKRSPRYIGNRWEYTKGGE